MSTRTTLMLVLRRLAFCFLAALFLVAAISELAFLFQQDRVARDPQTIELVIPAGTGERIAAGETVTGIPDELAFLIGDVLVVSNQDAVDHQLGPVWVPPGSRARLVLDEVDTAAYACSFQPSRYLGITVREPIGWVTRLTALALAVPPTAMLFLVYSLNLFPLDRKKENQNTATHPPDPPKPPSNGHGPGLPVKVKQ